MIKGSKRRVETSNWLVECVIEMAAARRVDALGAVVVVVVAVVLLLAGGADADCFDYCYRNCIANGRSMTIYCNYACDKICQAGKPLPVRPLAGAGHGDMDCQLSCAWASCHRLLPGKQERRPRATSYVQRASIHINGDGKAMDACFGRCYDGCKTTAALLPRPLRAGAGVHTALDPVLHSDMVYGPDPIRTSHPAGRLSPPEIGSLAPAPE
ncbi:hypothetical protein GUJ93_ZPchr0007g4578 [Zizania palustris]|uniref:Uncharacterized protein n=1 Tax=Zizania palustris TaxID=103762 RepID=A0A8J5T7P7_ZIZPA|nr:hypothetical protein GUJ93_ZPchr0007g4578 [Zizania palustris]